MTKNTMRTSQNSESLNNRTLVQLCVLNVQTGVSKKNHETETLTSQHTRSPAHPGPSPDAACLIEALFCVSLFLQPMETQASYCPAPV